VTHLICFGSKSVTFFFSEPFPDPFGVMSVFFFFFVSPVFLAVGLHFLFLSESAVSFFGPFFFHPVVGLVSSLFWGFVAKENALDFPVGLGFVSSGRNCLQQRLFPKFVSPPCKRDTHPPEISGSLAPTRASKLPLLCLLFPGLLTFLRVPKEFDGPSLFSGASGRGDVSRFFFRALLFRAPILFVFFFCSPPLSHSPSVLFVFFFFFHHSAPRAFCPPPFLPIQSSVIWTTSFLSPPGFSPLSTCNLLTFFPFCPRPVRFFHFSSLIFN